jgi:hypothetical protein
VIRAYRTISGSAARHVRAALPRVVPRLFGKGYTNGQIASQLGVACAWSTVTSPPCSAQPADVRPPPARPS